MKKGVISTALVLLATFLSGAALADDPWIYNAPGTYSTIGNMTYGPKSTCSSIGNMTYCN